METQTTTKESVKMRYSMYEKKNGKYGQQVYEFDTVTHKETKVKGGFYPEDKVDANDVRSDLEQFNRMQAQKHIDFITRKSKRVSKEITTLARGYISK